MKRMVTFKFNDGKTYRAMLVRENSKTVWVRDKKNRQIKLHKIKNSVSIKKDISELEI